MWPRHYALTCLALETKQARQRYLATQVPPEYRDWVKHYLREWWPRRAELLSDNKT